MTVSPIKGVFLVARRELNTRLRTRSFVVGTVVILLVLAGYLLLQATLIKDADTSKVGLTGQTTGIAAQLREAAEAAGSHVETVLVASPEQGEQQVRDGDLDALVSGSAADLRVVVESELDQRLRAVLNGIAQQQVLDAKLLEADLDPAQVMREVGQAQVQLTELEPRDADAGQRLAVGLVIVFLMFFAIQAYGGMVAQGVVEEKASRVVEILLSTLRPWQLMLGKVIGLGLVGLVQLLILAVAGLAMTVGSGVLTLGGVAIGTVAWGLLWYLLGFFLYATVYAAAGSLVSRQEDTASVVTPVSMTLMVGFVAGFNVLIQDPDSTGAQVLSLIPVFSPILMPGRIAAGVAATWEVAVALVLTVLFGALLTWVSGRVYRNAVLQTGSRVRLRAALRL
ncbi:MULTISPECIES: ABC transporter permease [Amycolatopsis]|uniref:ABC transporter permease n=1 Tax=Amycolatopsis thermalba TaxID=944492 RepID=A0ABY4P522_9PSEU|nr:MULTISPECIES: ABC transporter permease [Amycolatopsis]OXM73289.1 ABC transporter permease [Amycolatopsis sp. KNN50.9b]UQS27389.1 ABC transporter permease [Amycolatopsis thermalba]